MIKLLDIDNLKAEEIYEIWSNVEGNSSIPLNTNIAWSFEGNGIRTRTTFIQALQNLKLNYVELPNFLKTNESVRDLAGYMDSFFSMYIIRDNNHQRLKEFASATQRPVINAMSSEAHPCEVLTDAYFIHSKWNLIQDVRILLWGPTTNVFKSWYSLSKVLNLNITHFCPNKNHNTVDHINFIDRLTGEYDFVITDGWPSGFSDSKFRLSEQLIHEAGSPTFIPTPPVTVGNEIDTPIHNIDSFVGYQQKDLLLPIQQKIITYLLNQFV